MKKPLTASVIIMDVLLGLKPEDDPCAKYSITAEQYEDFTRCGTRPMVKFGQQKWTASCENGAFFLVAHY